MPKCSQCVAAMAETEPEESDIWFVDREEDMPTRGGKVYICHKCQMLEAEP